MKFTLIIMLFNLIFIFVIKFCLFNSFFLLFVKFDFSCRDFKCFCRN